MIKFTSMRYKNLLSTGNVFTTIFLDKSPSTLIVGLNGSGKSTMIDVLSFVLFGKPFRNINKPTLVNSINQKDAVGEVEFTDNVSKYKVVRGIKPSIFEIYVNGVLLNQEAESKDYQEVLEQQILKFNYKAFTQIVVLGSSSFVPFMQLAANERRVIIEDLLDINIFSSMNLVVKEKISVIKNRSAELKSLVEATMSKIDLQKKHIENAQKNNLEIIKTKQSEVEENTNHIDSLKKDIINIENEVKELKKTIKDETSLKEKEKKLHQFEAKIDNNIYEIKKQIEFYTKNSTCPSCEQEITNGEDKVHECKDKLVKYTEGLDKLQEEYKKISDRTGEIIEVQNKIINNQNQIAEINATISHTEKQNRKLLKEIEDLKSKKALSSDLMKVSKELVEQLEELNKERKALLEEKTYVDVAATLLKDTGIKSKIVKQYLPIINKLINKYLSSMGFSVNFEMDEQFNETIKSRHRDIFSYENFSEGEKMRIDLALLFTWRAIAKMKNSMNTNLLILDEVFDSSLDNSGTDEFMKLIQSLSESNVFVISHKGDVLQDKFKSLIRFEKVKNFSRIV